MCEYCGCQSVPAIAELTAEHDQIREVARDLDAVAQRQDLPVAVELAGRLLTLLASHTAVEERGLFPAMAGEFGAHVASLADDHRRIERVLGDLAADLATAAGAAPAQPRTSARALGFGSLDHPFRAWLASLAPDDDPHERRAAWQQQAYRMVDRLAHRLVSQAGDAAWEGRVIETRNGQKLWLTASRADLFFRTRLRKALPAATMQPPASQASSRAERPANQ